MKRHQYLRTLKVKALAQFLVHEITDYDSDEGMDGEWYSYPVTKWRTPMGTLSYDYENAVYWTICWLNSELTDEDKLMLGGQSCRKHWD